MNLLRRALAAALSVVILVPQAFAASLYSGIARPTAAPQTGPAVNTPRLPTAPTLGFDLGANMTPGVLAPIAQGLGPKAEAAQPGAAAPVPAAAAKPAVAAAKLSNGPAPASNSSQPGAPSVSAAQQAAKAADAVRNPRAQSGESATPQAALDAAFDGSSTGAGSSIPTEVNGSDAADVDSFIERASRLFHPALNGAAPAVAARTVPAPSIQGAIPSDGDLQARMELSPLTNPEREAAVITLFQAGGAAARVVDVPRGQSPDLTLDGVIQRQDAGRGRHNYIVVKKGKSDRVVVVGGHHDKVSEGAGTIDNWTGATMVTNLHQAMHGEDTDATFVFVAFAREEEGLLGSEAFVRSLTPRQKGQIDSMVNLDTLGVDGTFSWKNNSSRSLLDLVKKVAAKEKYDLVEAYLNGGDADSSTFLQAGIAAMTIFGASQDVIFDIIHTAADTIAAFSLPHYRNAYLLTLALLKTLDKTPVKPAGVI
jgi:hypothetical protein